MIAGAVRNVALAVDAEQLAVGIDDGDGVEACTPGQLEEADRQHHLQFGGDLLEMLDGRILLDRCSQLQVLRIRLLAEVGRLEQLLDEDDLRALGGSLTHQLVGIGDVGLAIPGTGHLGGGNGNDSGHGNLAAAVEGTAAIEGANLFDSYPD